MARLLGRLRRRNVRNTLLVVLAAVAVGLVVWMRLPNRLQNVWDAGILGLLLSVAGLAVSVADYFRDAETAAARDPGRLADDLAYTVRAQWVEESKARRLRDPRVLPIVWSSSERGVGDGLDSFAALNASPGTTAWPRSGGRVTRMHLDGRLAGRFDEVTRQLAESYRRLPGGRLVVLGEPGSGKSVVTILLALGLLDEHLRQAGGPVPVLVSTSSWDPVIEPLDDWLVRTIADLYYSGSQEIPRLLLNHGKLLTVLDGLDEIAETVRPDAVRALNHAIGRDRPIVVTCRTAEYVDVIQSGSPALRRAPVVEIAPVSAAHAVEYLTEINWPENTDWRPVCTDLLSRPDGAVAAALSTPLMLSLAKAVYQRCGGDPTELLDTARFDCRQAVEDFLLDRMIEAAYAPDRLPSGEPIDPARQKQDADQARRWLTYLARYLHEHRERDLAWWLLADRLLSPWAVLGIGISAVAVLMAGIYVWACSIHQLPEYRSHLGPVAAGGGLFGLLAMVTWPIGAGRAPGRLSFARRGSAARLRSGIRTGLRLTALPAVPGFIWITITTMIDGQSTTLRGLELITESLCSSAVLAAVLGSALAAHNWLAAPPERSTQAGPPGSLVRDRLSSLVGACAAGLVIGILTMPALTAGLFVGDVLAQELAGWPGYPGSLKHLGVIAAMQYNAQADSGSSMRMGAEALLPAAVFALLILLTRAWPRFVLARFVLAARGRLPWRLMRFLADARSRDLLRQTAGTYQFRHIRLQEWLVRTSTTPKPRPGIGAQSRAAFQLTRRKLLGITAAACAAAVLGDRLATIPRNTARLTLAPPLGQGQTTPYAVTAVGYSADGGAIATVVEVTSTNPYGPVTGQVYLWDADHGEPYVPVLNSPTPAFGVWWQDDAGTDDPHVTVACQDGTVRTLEWNAATAKSEQIGSLSIPGWSSQMQYAQSVTITCDVTTVFVFMTVNDSNDTVPQYWLCDNASLFAHPEIVRGTVELVGVNAETGAATATVYIDAQGKFYVSAAALPKMALPVKLLDLDMSDVTAIALSADGQCLVVGFYEGVVGVWQLSDLTGNFTFSRAFNGHTGQVNAIAFKHDENSTFVTGSSDGTARVWTMA
jgi:hypothetical protein